MKLLEPYYRINAAAGLGVHLRQDGTVDIHGCTLTARGNQLDIVKKLLNIPDGELIKHLPTKTAIALNLSGKGVLHKQVEGTETIGPGNFSKVMPNANLDDFYIQQFISGDSSFVSVIRRAEADRWINQLRQQGLIPLALSLGPFPAAHILPQVNVYDQEIRFNGHIIRLSDQKQWINYTPDETTKAPFILKVESEPIDERLIVPYAAAFQLIMASRLDPIQAGTLKEAFQSKLDRLKLRVNSLIVLSCFFVFLLVNFALFSGLDSANKILAAKVSRFAQTTSNDQDIAAQVKQKQALLENLGWDGGISKSVLIDQLASLMPEEITLEEIAVNPPDLNSSRNQRSLVFLNRRINLTGTSDEIIPVNEWMARIKTRPWAKNVRLDSYTYNSEFNTGQFTLSLNY